MEASPLVGDKFICIENVVSYAKFEGRTGAGPEIVQRRWFDTRLWNRKSFAGSKKTRRKRALVAIGS
jgi:hypothetical protein